MEGTGITEAIAMLHAFGSVGTSGYTLTRTDIHRQPWQKKPSEHFPHADFTAAAPSLLAGALGDDPHNLIIRPEAGQARALVQLDDLTLDALRRVLPFSFLSLETSPGNFQAWLALDTAGSALADKDLLHRLKRGLEADLGANGAVRLAGSRNIKPVHAPTFPAVRLNHTVPGLQVSLATLSISGLALPPEPPARAPRRSSLPIRRSRGRGWPDYQRCLDGAPMTRDGSGPDVSLADYTFCIIAKRWGWSVEDIAAQLIQVSPKGAERGLAYARMTATKAAAEAQAAPPRRA